MQLKEMGGKVYVVCEDCGQIVRFDKPILGSFHICTLPEERRQFAGEIRRRVAAAKRCLFGEAVS